MIAALASDTGPVSGDGPSATAEAGGRRRCARGEGGWLFLYLAGPAFQAGRFPFHSRLLHLFEAKAAFQATVLEDRHIQSSIQANDEQLSIFGQQQRRTGLTRSAFYP